MKYAEPRPYADPEKAARRIVEIARSVEPVQDGRIHVELIERGWLTMHESGTYVRFTPAGADLFA
jgi:hypothetical protein